MKRSINPVENFFSFVVTIYLDIFFAMVLLQAGALSYDGFLLCYGHLFACLQKKILLGLLVSGNLALGPIILNSAEMINNNLKFEMASSVTNFI